MAVQPRMGMAPPGQQIGAPPGQPTIVLGRPGQPGSTVVSNPGQIVRQQFVPPGGGIRVQGPFFGNHSNIPASSFFHNQALQGSWGSPGGGIPYGQAGNVLFKGDTQLQCNNPVGMQPPNVRLMPTQQWSQHMLITSNNNVMTTQSGYFPPMPQPRSPWMGPTIVSSTPFRNQTPTLPLQHDQAQSSPTAKAFEQFNDSITPEIGTEKCKNFFITLMKLGDSHPPGTGTEVRKLIQGLIDNKIQPEQFSVLLQQVLRSTHQPSLVKFIKIVLPHLQKAIYSGGASVEGLQVPASLQSPVTKSTSNQQSVNGTSASLLASMSLPKLPASTVIYQTSEIPTTEVLHKEPLSITRAVVRPSLTKSPLPTPVSQNTTLIQMTKTSSPNMSSSSLMPKGINKFTPMTKLPTAPVPMPLAGKSPTPTFATKTVIQPPLGQPYGQTSKLSVSFSSLQPTPPSALTTSSKLSTPSLSASLSTSSLPGSSSAPSKYPDKKSSASSSSYSATGDEDINDVAAMGGVNLAEETQRMAATDLIGNQVLRSCKDETFLQTGLLSERISRICKEKGLEAPPTEVVALVSHATQERLKSLLEKLSVVAEHRLDIVKATDEGERYEVTQDVRGQLKFLNDLEKIERKKHDEAERELLFRAAKSRTKTEDPEKEKLKAKAKELQRIEEEQLRHEKANNTARLAIGGPRKRLKLDGTEFGPGSANAIGSSGMVGIGSSLGFAGSAGLGNRPRTKRVHLRDLLFLMEQEKELKRSPLLWKSYSS